MKTKKFNNVSIVKTHECTGCSACANACPHNCIEMRCSQYDFALHPTIGINCTQCGICQSVCPVLNKKPVNKFTPKVYAFKNTLDIRKKSSSGGAFYFLSQYILLSDGFVYGAAFKNQNGYSVEHICINDLNDLGKLQGSKYIQSRINNIYADVKEKLTKHPYNLILFSGTPCQIAGLKLFLKKDYDNLLTVDIVCHGVGSEELFSKYIMENYTNYKGIGFRDKRYSASCTNLYLYDLYNNADIKKHTDEFEISFHRSLIVRESCLNCKYSTLPRVADISLGDFWGISKINKEKYKNFNDGKGISIIIINSEKGEKFFNKISKQDIEIIQIEGKEYLKYNSFGQKRIAKGDRSIFFKNILYKTFKESVRLSIEPQKNEDTTVKTNIENNQDKKQITQEIKVKELKKSNKNIFFNLLKI